MLKTAIFGAAFLGLVAGCVYCSLSPTAPEDSAIGLGILAFITMFPLVRAR